MGLAGITLLLPASYFMLTIMARLLIGIRSPYYFIAPSFLQDRFDPFALHKAQFIMGSLLAAILLNILAIFRFHLINSREVSISYRRNGLNTAIALQGVLLFLLLLAYTIVQHIRY
jgi:hypothetical protein